jgi:hypothetical protein
MGVHWSSDWVVLCLDVVASKRMSRAAAEDEAMEYDEVCEHKPHFIANVDRIGKRIGNPILPRGRRGR